MSDLTIKTTCRVCYSPNIHSVLDLGSTPVGDAYFTPAEKPVTEPLFPVELFLCPDCGLAQLAHVVNPELLYGHFTYRTSISLGLVRHFESYAKHVLTEIRPNPSSFVVDIGSNDGTLLKFFKDAGMRVLGIDPAREIAKEAISKGIETWDTYFNLELAQKISHQFGKADVITTNNTFANIDDLHPFIEGIRSLLAPNGTLVLETGYALDLVQNGLFDNIYHEHLSYFPLCALIDLFRHHQLSVVHAARISTKGGSIRVFVQHAAAAPLQSNEAIAILRLEQGLKNDAPYHALAQRLDNNKQIIRKYLDKLNAAGQIIAGYGASVGSTTFIYYFQLGEQLQFLIDDNVIKHGRLSPGTHLPVLSFEQALLRKPNYIAIISWRYADAIISGAKEFLNSGGKIISLYPELVLIDRHGSKAIKSTSP